jgi:hypothetical protein
MDTPAPAAFVFDSPSDAEVTAFALSRAGADVTKLSLIGTGSSMEDRPLGFYTKGRNIKACGGISAFCGAILGMLFAPAVLHLPGLGLVAMAGPIVSQLVDVLEGAVVVRELSPLGAALTLMGVQGDQIPRCEMAIRTGKYLLVLGSGSRELLQARATLLSLSIPCVA